MHLLRYYCAGRHPYEWHAICSPIIVLAADHSRIRPGGHVHKLNPSRAPVWPPNYSPPLETNGHIPRILRIMRLLCKSNNCFLVHISPQPSFLPAFTQIEHHHRATGHKARSSGFLASIKDDSAHPICNKITLVLME